MRFLTTIAAVAALALGGAAVAATNTTSTATHTGPWVDAQGKCRQANGQLAAMTVCKPPAATHTAATAPKCTTGKVCGNSCIAKTAVCHKP
jgi:hypothetical protein